MDETNPSVEILVDRDGPTTRVLVDGVDVAKGCTAFKLEQHAGYPPMLWLGVPVDRAAATFLDDAAGAVAATAADLIASMEPADVETAAFEVMEAEQLDSPTAAILTVLVRRLGGVS